MRFFDRLLGRPTAPAEPLCTILLPDAGPEWARHLARLPRTLQAKLVDQPFDGKLDVRFADGRPDERAYVRVQLAPSQNTIAERTAAIRRATELARKMVDDGALGIVIHRAGDVLYSPEGWAHRTQRISEPAWTPALAWMDLGRHEGVVLSYGLAAFGLPEVAVVEDALPGLGEDEAWHRAQEAVLAAVCTMVGRGSALANEEMLRVIPGTEFSGAPLHFDNLGLDEIAADTLMFADWRCAWFEHTIQLVPPPILPLAKLFASLQSTGLMPYPPYRWLFLERMRARGYRKVAHLWPRQLANVPAYEVLILQHEDGHRFLTTTCGLGRVAQPGGTEAAENQYIELAVELPAEDPDIATALGVLALMVHLKDPGSPPIGRAHRAATHSIPFPYEWVVYDSLPDLDLGGTSPVRLYQPLFMSASERERVPQGENWAWIEAHRAEALARWIRQ